MKIRELIEVASMENKRSVPIDMNNNLTYFSQS